MKRMDLKTKHKIFFCSSERMDKTSSDSVEMVLTSPPYPMVEIWDEHFSKDARVKDALLCSDDMRAFELMHEKLDSVWEEVSRVLIPGGLACINIGDATRKFGNSFRLYSNHSRIIKKFETMGFHTLPSIIWRKSTTKPNKFMGSGMEPPNAYVTLEHEYVLIFRKGGLRKFRESEKENRRKSAYFWEERNRWFSDVWTDIRGASQRLDILDKGDSKDDNKDDYKGDKKIRYMRVRSAAYPFEFAYRLINMYSLIGDKVLDPFCGTGTTLQAAVVSGRNSIGYEIDANFRDLIIEKIEGCKELSRNVVNRRLKEHITFMEKKEKEGNMHFSKNYGFEVVTAQERDIALPIVDKINKKRHVQFEEYEEEYEVEYSFECKFG